MAANYISSDSTKFVCRDRDRYLKMAKEAMDGLAAVLATMQGLSDGARDSAADFDLLATEGAFSPGDYADASTAAKASYDQINSVVGNYNAGTLSKAAVDQANAYHGLS